VITGPVGATLTFSLRRPKKLPTRYPVGQRSGDVDKLARAALDAMTGVVYLDDAQVVSLLVTKCWAEADTAPGVEVLVREIG
jgi:crossover junction endodeoxyribonuclease RusA